MKLESGEQKSLSVSCQFLMTLLILRRNRLYQDVAHQFDLDRNLVSNVFITWLCFMYNRFRLIQEEMFQAKLEASQ